MELPDPETTVLIAFLNANLQIDLKWDTSPWSWWCGQSRQRGAKGEVRVVSFRTFYPWVPGNGPVGARHRGNGTKAVLGVGHLSRLSIHAWNCPAIYPVPPAQLSLGIAQAGVGAARAEARISLALIPGQTGIWLCGILGLGWELR